MKKISGVIMDWAGTAVDYGCFAPLNAFLKVFSEEKGIDITYRQAREPMGLLKIDHIKAILSMPEVNEKFRALYKRDWNKGDVDEMYASFEKHLFASLKDFTTPIPGVLETMAMLREQGIKIGSTTGYTAKMMEIVRPGAEAKGYRVDNLVTPNEVPAGRPAPYMIYKNMIDLAIPSVDQVVKVGDTIADIKEGVNAKVWSVGIVTGSNEMGVSEEEYNSRPEDKLLILANGAYGKRMAQIADYYHINYVLVSLHETELVTGEVARRALEEHPGITHLSMVHSETTTGLLNPIEEVAEVIKGRGITFIVDAMSSFGGVPIDVKGLGIDFLVSSANKCIQGVPGFGFILAPKDKLMATKGNARSLSLDIYAQWEAMEKGGGKWRFTSPTHVVHAFYQAMKELNEEGGITARYKRYQENHQILVEGMRGLGFKTLLPDDAQGPIITSFLYPSADFDFTSFYARLKEKGFVIYPGKISDADTFRIGNIGDIFPKDMEALIQAIKEIR